MSRRTVEQAWQKYVDDCEEMRELFLAQPILATYPELKANALFILQQTQAMAYNLVMAPRYDNPSFYQHNFFEPMMYTAHQPNPDFPYQLAFLNGARTWKISGQRNSAHWVDLHVSRGWWGESDFEGLGNYDLDDFEINADGSFEIIASPEPQPGNWIRLDASNPNNSINMRPAMYDWDNEVIPELHIEPMDTLPAAPMIHDEDEIIRRLELTGEMIKHCIGRWTIRGSPALVRKVGKNAFHTRWGDARNGGANPGASYGQAVYEVAEDQALLIEFTPPKAKYWSVSLGTWWWETINITHHKTSINGFQAVTDSDGVFRAVISHDDPGVVNWLDPAGWRTGIILARFYRPEAEVGMNTRLVAREALADHLPTDTVRIDPAQRSRELTGRRKAINRWYRY